MKHLVSIIIPCYNQGLYINECIESITNQTYSNIEMIIVNDGSTDQHTNSILKDIENRQIPKLKIIWSENKGASEARNIGIRNSNGYYILPLDGDDKIEASYVEKAVNVLDGNEAVGIVYCKARMFGSKNSIWELEEFSMDRILFSNSIFITAMYRRKDYDRTRGYNPNMIYGYEDWDFWLSMLELGVKVHRIDEVLFYYRIKEASITIDLLASKKKANLMTLQLMKNHSQFYKTKLKSAFYARYLYVFLKCRLSFINKVLNRK